MRPQRGGKESGFRGEQILLREFRSKSRAAAALKSCLMFEEIVPELGFEPARF